MSYYTFVDYTQASKWLRFVNYTIDLIVFFVLSFIIGISLGVFFVLIGREELIDEMDNLLDNGGILTNIAESIYYFLFMFGCEVLFKGRTIGKFITGTKVVTEEGEKLTTKQYFIRNISRIVPFDSISFFGEVGWHDKWSNTRVVRTKSFDFEKEAANAIDEIGKSNG